MLRGTYHDAHLLLIVVQQLSGRFMFMLNKTAITNWRLHFAFGHCALSEQIQVRVRLRLCAVVFLRLGACFTNLPSIRFACFTYIENRSCSSECKGVSRFYLAQNRFGCRRGWMRAVFYPLTDQCFTSVSTHRVAVVVVAYTTACKFGRWCFSKPSRQLRRTRLRSVPTGSQRVFDDTLPCLSDLRVYVV